MTVRPNDIVRNNEEQSWAPRQFSLVSCYMTYNPPEADSPESWDHVCTLQSCRGAVVAPLSEVPQEGSSVFSLFYLISSIWPPTHWLVATVV